jgi:heme exporter protein C
MAGLLLVLVGSVGYLITRRERWDVIAVAAAEPSLLYATLVLVTGPLWARPSWNVYWKWEDPRLMSFFAWWLILIGYHLLRNFNEDGTSRRITSAALGIVGAISVPFVFYSVKLGRSLHPKPIEVNAQVRFTTIVFLCAFSLLFVLLFQLRYRLECQRNRLWECEQSLPDD